MYNSGDAAEQVVRMSLEGAEVALKITGAAAKNLAAALYTVLKDQKKTKGKARIETMLREKRPLKVYTIKKEDCPEFARQAKGYGILYAPIRMIILACVNKACFIFLQAMGKAVESTALSMIREVVFGVGFALLLPVFFGLDGVLFSMPVSDILTFLVAVFLIFRTYKELNQKGKMAQ